MKIYSAPLSLFSRKVEIALHEKNIAFDRIMVPFNQKTGYAPKHPDVLAANPKAQVPVMVDGELKLYDSTVIMEYLEDAYPQPSLYPTAAAERARCRLLDVFADEVMLVPLRALMHRTGPKPDDHAAWLALEEKATHAESMLAGHFTGLDAGLSGKQHFCGAFSVADISIFMTLFFSQRLGARPFNHLTSLSGWYARMIERPAFAKVVAEMKAADAELSQPVPGAYGAPR